MASSDEADSEDAAPNISGATFSRGNDDDDEEDEAGDDNDDDMEDW